MVQDRTRAVPRCRAPASGFRRRLNVVNSDMTFEALEQEWLALTAEAESTHLARDLELVGEWEVTLAGLSAEVARPGA